MVFDNKPFILTSKLIYNRSYIVCQPLQSIIVWHRPPIDALTFRITHWGMVAYSACNAFTSCSRVCGCSWCWLKRQSIQSHTSSRVLKCDDLQIIWGTWMLLFQRNDERCCQYCNTWPVVVVLKYGVGVLQNGEDMRLVNFVSVTLCG